MCLRVHTLIVPSQYIYICIYIYSNIDYIYVLILRVRLSVRPGCDADCSVCEKGYSSTLAFTCKKCSDSNTTTMLTVAIVVMVIAAAGGAYLTVYLVSMEPDRIRMTRPHVRLLQYIPLQAIKTLVVLWQILTQV